MSPATTQGRDVALAALAARRVASRGRPRTNNASLPAGAPIYLPCVACGTEVAHPEDYLVPRRLCAECEALQVCGWLE